MNIIQNIFNDHYEEIKYILHPRKSVMENIDKMLGCGDPSFGGAMYGCEKCGELKFVPFRCHSRFCPTCGNHYSMERTTNMSFKLIQCQHRHCVFTIPEELRHFFLEDRNLLNLLFLSVRDVVLRMFAKINKAELFTPGFICVLHTFGRDLKWNPHVHVLLSEGGAGNLTTWRHVRHFSYPFLRHSFRTVLLNHMEASIGPLFKSTKSEIYRQCDDGFYVYAKPNKCSPFHVAKYIGRYLGRPPIAKSRIDRYDGDSVTFHYNRHEDDSLVYETIPAMEFIGRLIRHIPEKHFKMIRYYGLYAKHHKQSPLLFRAIRKEKHKILRSFNEWRTSIRLCFGYDPLKCPHCGAEMSLLEVYYKKVPLLSRYRKLMDSS